MSALAGIWYWDGRPVLDTDMAILRAHSHATGQADGVMVRPNNGLALQAHVLRFDTLSEGEKQPYVFGRGSVVTFDGRLDNRDDLLLRLHHEVGSDLTDVSLVANAYSRWGLDCLGKLVGDWSLAIWDADELALILARDYAGNRPLYYRETGNGVAWATRLTALAECFDLYSSLNEDYIVGKLTFGVPNGLTPFRGVRALNAAHVLVAKRNRCVVRRYWTIGANHVRLCGTDDYTDCFRELLIDGVRSRLRARGTVWSHLSGGWDSSSLVCIASTLVKHRQVEATHLQPLSLECKTSPEFLETDFVAAVERWCDLNTVKHDFTGFQDFESLLGQSCLQTQQHSLLAQLEQPVSASGAMIVFSGALGDLVSLQSGSTFALLEPLHEGRPIRALKLLLSRARHTKKPFFLSLFRLIAAAYFPQRVDRTSTGLRFHLGRLRSPSRSASNSFGATAATLARAQPQPTGSPVRQFSSVKRPLIGGLMSWLDSDQLMSPDRFPNTWRTYPYSHRPLVEFVLAIPQLALWDPVIRRSGMRRSLAGVLPPEFANKTAKTSAQSMLARARREQVASLLRKGSPAAKVADWELVQRGYLDASALRLALEQMAAGDAANAIYRDDWIFLEAWLRTISGRQHAAPSLSISDSSSNRLYSHPNAVSAGSAHRL